MTPAEVVQALWDRIQGRDWEGARALLDDDVQVEWPATCELISGADHFISVQSEYPGGWSIRVLRVVQEGEAVVSEVEVPHEGVGLFRAASFWTVRDGLITRGREYWVTVGGDTPPEWRRAFATVQE